MVSKESTWTWRGRSSVLHHHPVADEEGTFPCPLFFLLLTVGQSWITRSTALTLDHVPKQCKEGSL